MIYQIAMQKTDKKFPTYYNVTKEQLVKHLTNIEIDKLISGKVIQSKNLQMWVHSTFA